MPEHDEHCSEPDGCLCHAPVADHEATADHDLPAAKGGVVGDRAPRKRKTDKAAVGEGD